MSMQRLPFHRRVLLWVFVLMFFIIAPAVLFYTAGYRWNPKKGAIERYGTLIVDTRPNGASIFLNGELQDGESPATFKEVAPGTYAIRLEREGYYPWEKTLDVRPEKVTFVNDIELWKRDEPERIISGAFEDIILSENGRYVAGIEEVDGGRVLAFTALSNGERTRASLNLDESVQIDMEWNDDSSAVLLRTSDEGAWVVTVRNPERAIRLPAGFYRWDGSQLIGSLPGERYTYDVSNDTTQRTALAPGVMDVEGSYEIIRATGTRELLVVDSAKRSLQYALPSGDWHFAPALNGMVFLERDGEWLGFEPSEDVTSVARLKTAGQPDEARIDGDIHLLTHVDGEIWLMALGTDPELILRKSTPILDVEWQRRLKHVFYATERDVVVLGLDERDRRLETVLASFDEIYGMDVLKREVYISASKNGERGVWMLEVE